MNYEDIVEAILILIGPMATQDVVNDVYFEVVIRRTETHGGFAATVAKAAGLVSQKLRCPSEAKRAHRASHVPDFRLLPCLSQMGRGDSP